MSFKFLTPSQIIYGSNALDSVKETIKVLGTKAFIVTDTTMIKLGNLDKLTSLLESCDISFYVYSEINSEPTDTMIYEGITEYKKNKCDFLIGLGGGSPLDSMKIIAAMLNSDTDISTFIGKSIDLSRPKMIAIPTTAGTGSEATQFTIIKNTSNKVKMLLKGSCLIPDIAIIDPQFTLTAPKEVTSSTGVDALCHAIEAYTSKKAHSLSNTFALSAIDRIINNLYTCYNDPDNIEARTQMSLGSLEAGIAFNNSSVTIIHGMSRPLGALFNIPHGLSNAMLLRTCINYIKEDIIQELSHISRYCDLADENANDKEASDVFVNKVNFLLENLNIPSLSRYGVDKNIFFSLIPKMAKDAMESGSPSNTKKALSASDLEALYKKLYI